MSVATPVDFRLRDFVSGPHLTSLPTLFDSSWPHDWPHVVDASEDCHTDLAVQQNNWQEWELKSRE
jgi:hypothetical protein